MKIRVIKNAWYNMEYIKGSEGRIIDFKGDKAPSWGEVVKSGKNKEDKKQEVKTPQGNGDEQNNGGKAPEVKPDEHNKDDDVLNEVEKQQYLDLLINEAMEKDIVIEDADKKSVDEQIAELEAKLGKGK